MKQETTVSGAGENSGCAPAGLGGITLLDGSGGDDDSACGAAGGASAGPDGDAEVHRG